MPTAGDAFDEDKKSDKLAVKVVSDVEYNTLKSPTKTTPAKDDEHAASSVPTPAREEDVGGATAATAETAVPSPRRSRRSLRSSKSENEDARKDTTAAPSPRRSRRSLRSSKTKPVAADPAEPGVVAASEAEKVVDGDR